MSAKTLVVGQIVYMGSGVYANKGVVVKASPEGYEIYSRFTHELLRFYPDGKGWEADGTFECGPWELLDYVPAYFRTNDVWVTVPEFASTLIQVTTEHPEWEASDRLKETHKRAAA
jgi:hypothetical protein